MADKNYYYYLHLIKCGLNGVKPELPGKGTDLNKVLNYAREQGVLSVVTDALLSSDIPVPDKAKEALKNEYYREVRRNIICDTEFENVKKIISENGIDIRLVAFKGYAMKKYYPKSFYRTMSDIDVFYVTEEFERLKTCLLENGYEYMEGFDEETFLKKPVFKVEFHKKAFFQNDKRNEIFLKMLEECTDENGNTEFTPEAHAVISIEHAAKHFQGSGFGIKPVMDLYVLEKFGGADRQKVRETLKDTDLVRFCDLLYKSADAWFGDGEGDTDTEMLARFVSGGANYGNAAKKKIDDFARDNGKTPSKFRFLLTEIFVKKEVIYNLYPFCDRHRFLLPFFYVIRIISRALFGKKTTKGKKVAQMYSKDIIDVYKYMSDATGLEIRSIDNN